MTGRGHGKERQMNYEGENTSFVRNGGLCLSVSDAVISLENAQKTIRDTLGRQRSSRLRLESALPEAGFGE